MTDYRYPLSPPTSTSLPEHWQFAPPATDGPNTRARLAEGLHPHSGAAPPRQRIPRSREVATDVWSHGEADQGRPAVAEPQWTASNLAMSGEYALDPLLEDAAIASSSAWHRDSNTDAYRNFSTATFIDHGSPPRSPIDATRVETQTIELAPGQSVGSLGLTKEEWLRLGGFAPEAEDAYPPPVETTRAIEPSSITTMTVGIEPVTYSMPLPPSAWSAGGDRFVLPDAPADLHGTTSSPLSGPAHDDLRPANSTIGAALPTPPPLPSSVPARGAAKLSDDDEFRLPEPVSRTPARSQRRRAPSPIQAHRVRPAPYPTSSAEGEILVDAPELTPVRAALARYPDIPMPAVPPSPIEPPPGKKKKSHGRKMSADHIPRPRNAFILFRSHAITSGLIPRSIGVKDHKNISQIVGGVWRGLSAPERQQWEELAEEEKRRHLAKYPDYAYRPKQKEGPRATPGQGKKARAKAARLAADYGSLLHERDDYDEEGFDDGNDVRHARSATQTSSASSTSSTRASSAVPPGPADPAKQARYREERQMALIAQAVLEGEEDECLMSRVDEQLERELGPTPPSAPAAGRPRSKRKGAVPVIAASSSRRKKDDSSAQSSEQPSPSKKAKSSPVTPRKTPSKAQAAGPPPEGETPPKRSVPSSYTSPTSSDSTISPSPFRRMAYQANGRPVSPASSNSPSPVRMYQPSYNSNGTKRAASYGQHPLSRSRSAPEEDQADDLPSTLRGKKGTYSAAGLGVYDPLRPAYGLPSPSLSDQAGATPYTFPSTDVPDVPLFTGPTDSRQFSLGKWEIRKPSTAVTSRRELLAQQVEEAEEWRSEQQRNPVDGAPGFLFSSVTDYVPAAPGLSFDPSEFLVDVGVSNVPSKPPYPAVAGERDDASTEYGTAYSSSLFDEWQSETASSIYESAPSTSAHSASRMSMPASMAKKFPQGLFRQPSSALSVAAGPSLFAAQQQQYTTQTTAANCEPISATATAGASPEEQLFHFGAADLFAQPPASFSLFSSSTGAATEWPSGLLAVSDGQTGSMTSYPGPGISVNPVDTNWQ